MSSIITIGQHSNNEPQRMSLAQLPHLFVSYTDPADLGQFFHSLGDEWRTQKAPIDYALALTQPTLDQFAAACVTTRECFIYRKGSQSLAAKGSKEQFFRSLQKEMRRRMSLLQKDRDGKTLSSMVIVFDDIIEMLTSPARSVSLSFLQLLLRGKSLGMHVFAVSTRSQHFLVKQMLQSNTKLRIKFPLAFGPGSAASVPGSELVISGEGLYFFRSNGSNDYQRFYPLVTRIRERELVDN